MDVVYLLWRTRAQVKGIVDVLRATLSLFLCLFIKVVSMWTGIRVGQKGAEAWGLMVI